MTSEIIKAEPTKAFFISMLVRDISLIPAIIDLVDNSVDGARRLRPKTSKGSPTQAVKGNRFANLWINIRIDGNSFEISDNCGGIPWKIARDYAFRFGRPDGAPDTPNSIGQFGIGMKRSLFKFGKTFSIDSKSAEEYFKLDVDVKEWEKSPEWTFSNVTYRHEVTPPDAAGTIIKVNGLYDSVAENFSESRFHNELIEELARTHQATINDGLSITLNSIPVNVNIQTLISANELQPAHLIETLDESSDRPVHIEIFAGIDRSAPASAGWYIYCNGRLILGPDQTSITGWGEGNGKTLPRYHNQFARFRGYVFFESSDVEKLPWTTTKEGIDGDHRMYRAIRPKMIEVARPVIDFLNALDNEKDHPDREDLEKMVRKAERESTAPISSVPESPKFVSPSRTAKPKSTTKSIQYSRPAAQIEKAKAWLEVSSNREVGEGTFDYFYQAEFGDDDE
ncbi:ATP-binding protein [Mycobacteroides chelonae]|uniref:ATP-binding protein n=1 Tax=Mycobacteroides chelonae TaxID=1774 RepID=A0A1S1M2P7_MYCCH|nr:ATP-binding protein [Mycobacteroides chelonae]OHU77881.1 hypothetical protein BKG84_05220 [Mycobacteroides chelonae]QQG86947.1 ATP-binding protein [Mycobacteroides chelonae]QQG91763.1 ATP-binding protein [Mycobacteroides chelonae]